MPESPDFDQLAYAILVRNGRGPLPFEIAPVADQLRQVWNARGAADLVKLEAELSSMMGVTASGPYVKNLDRALKTLDR